MASRNKSLNSISSSYKMIESLQKIWTKPLNPYGLVLWSLDELFEASKCCDRNLSKISKISSFVFWRWTEVLQVWNNMRES